MALKHKNDVLEDSIKKISELRDFEKESNRKLKHVISEYEKQFAEVSKHN